MYGTKNLFGAGATRIPQIFHHELTLSVTIRCRERIDTKFLTRINTAIHPHPAPNIKLGDIFKNFPDRINKDSTQISFVSPLHCKGLPSCPSRSVMRPSLKYKITFFYFFLHFHRRTFHAKVFPLILLFVLNCTG